MIFIVCSHEHKDGKTLYRCIESIRKIYQKNKIVVVDTGSKSTEYLNSSKVFNIEILNSGPNYELGAWKKALNTLEDDHYICIQDSTFLLSSIDFIKNKDFSSYHIVPNGLVTMPGDSYKLVLNTLNSYNVKYDKIHVIFGCMFMISDNIKNKLINNNFFKDFYPKNKMDSYICERVLYPVFESFDIDVLNSGINENEKGRGKYFHKEWLDRQ